MKASPRIQSHRFSDCLARQCDQLSGILCHYQEGKINTSLIKQILEFSQQIIEISKTFPHQLVAQLQFYRSQYSYSHNLVFNQTIATYLVLTRNRWNDTSIQHLLCICVTQFAGVVHKLNKLPDNTKLAEHWPSKKHLNQSNAKLIQALEIAGLEVWHQGLKTASQRWHPHRLSPLQRLPKQSTMLQMLSIGCCLGRLVTVHQPAEQAPLHFSEALKYIARQLPTACYSLIEAVLTSPGLIPPGSFVKLNNTQIWLVLSRVQMGVLGKMLNKSSGEIGMDIHLIPDMKIRHVMPPQPIKKLTLNDSWWDTDWQMQTETANTDQEQDFLRIATFKIDTPPPTLLAIQQKLQQPDFDTNEITDLILKEPVFATHIKQTASQSSRENLIIEDVKHGLLMHGFERTSSLLMEHALSVRVSQNAFPLQESLQQLCVAFKHVMSALAQETKLLSAEQASCWASFACAGFFTSTSLKTQLALQFDNCVDPQTHRLFHHADPNQLHNHNRKLASSWAQSPILTDAMQTLVKQTEFSQTKQSVKQLALMLGCSTILARHIFFGNSIQKQEKHYLRQAFDELNILHIPYSFIVNEALASSHCFIPLHQ